MISMNWSLYLSLVTFDWTAPLGDTSIRWSLSIWVVTDQCKWVCKYGKELRVFIVICLETIIGFHFCLCLILRYDRSKTKKKTVVSIWCLFSKYSIWMNRLFMFGCIVSSHHRIFSDLLCRFVRFAFAIGLQW